MRSAHRLWHATGIGALAWSLLVFAPTEATAACGRKEKVTSVTPFYAEYVWIPTGAAATFETFDLTAGSDTVLHFQKVGEEPESGFGGGNDDCVQGAPHSCVTFPSVGYHRTFVLIVRAYYDTTAGAAKLRKTIGGTVTETSLFTFGGKFVPNSGVALHESSIAAYTRRIQKQATTPVLLLMGTTSSEAVKFNDIWFDRLTYEGSHSGQLIVGVWPSTPTGDVDVLWDEEYLTNDTDGDGLGNCLETVLTTNINEPDTDGDAINDGLEVLGDPGWNTDDLPLELSAWGADPKLPDKFVEMDWTAFNQVETEHAQSFVDFFKEKEPGSPGENNIRLHVDIGVDNPNPAGHSTLTEWGNWRGANEVTAVACDPTYKAANRSMFHLGIAQPSGTGGTASVAFWCLISARQGRVLAHELGHNMNLGHSGSRLSGEANFKAIYESPMNYGYDDEAAVVRFGTNKFGGVVVNPTAINETTWQGSNNASLDLLKGTPFNPYKYHVEGKALDWNQDNLIQDAATTVMGRINAPGESGHMRGETFPGEMDPTLVRLDSGTQNRLYMFTRTGSASLLRRYSTNNVNAACSAPGNPWVACAMWTASAAVPGTPAPFGTTFQAPAVAKFVAGSTNKLMVVYVDNTSHLRFLTLSLSAFGNEIWTAPVYVDTTTIVSEAPAAVWDSAAGRVDLYAISSGALKRWSYNVASESWDVLAAAQTWSTGGNVAPTAGLGLTWGYQKGSTSQHLYALVPYGESAVMDHVRRSPSVANQWEKVAATNARTDTRPGFVYRPYQNGTAGVQNGRFMYLIRDLDYASGDPPNVVYAPVVGITEGNDPNCSASNQGMCAWNKNWFSYEGDRDRKSAEALFYEPGLDSNVRGARSTDGNSVQFGPLADGFVNFGFRDYYDYAALKANIGCGIGGACKYCQGLNPDGTCTSYGVTNPPLP